MTIIFISILFFFVVIRIFDSKIMAAEVRLKIAYSHMERYILINSKRLNKLEIFYLKHYKEFTVNTEYLDPKVNIALRLISKKNKSIGYSYLKSLKKAEEKYPDIIELRKNFEKNASYVYKLNLLKFRNWDICIFCTIALAYELLISKKNHLNKVFEKLIGERYIRNHNLIESLNPYHKVMPA